MKIKKIRKLVDLTFEVRKTDDNQKKELLGLELINLRNEIICEENNISDIDDLETEEYLALSEKVVQQVQDYIAGKKFR